jgi:hypothetical protein
VASGPDQPPAGPSRLAGSLARHRWVAAAAMTAAVAVVAGGGLALARHDGSAGPPEQCGLVPCAAALPASVRSGGRESAGAPATVVPRAAPTATQRAAAPPLPVASATAPAASAAAPGAAPGSVTPGSGAPGSGAPGSGAPAGRPASADRVFVPAPRSSCTTVIAFTARGPVSAPVRCRFTVAAVRQQRGRDRSRHPGSGLAGQDSDRVGLQLRSGRSSHDGRLGSWLSGWLSRGWSGARWSGAGRPGVGWSAGGWPGQRGGWPGGR